MASGVPNPKAARARPAHYYEGMMKKKGPGELVYKKFWSGLLGNVLYFYNHHKDMQYVDVINLDDFVSLLDDDSRCTVPTEAKMTLELKDRTIHLKVDSVEYREMWKGFILTVIEMKVPEGLSLLPGPRHMMLEVLQQEQRRRAELEMDYDEARDEELLPCFYQVSRMEAQDMLEKHPECGNLILRPGQDGISISVSTCQKSNGVNQIRHYRVSQNRGVYTIEVDQAVRCTTLFAVMDYFVEKTNNALVPFHMETEYEDSLNFIPVKEENRRNIIRNTARGPTQQDTRGTTGPQSSSRIPPPLPSAPPPVEDEDEDQDTDEEDEQLYMNEDAKPVVRNSSVGQQGSCTLPRAQTKLPPTPALQPMPKAEASFSDRQYSLETQAGRDVTRPSLVGPRQALMPMGRGSEIRRICNEKDTDLPPHPTPRHQSLPNSEKRVNTVLATYDTEIENLSQRLTSVKTTVADSIPRRSSEGQVAGVPRQPAIRQRCFPTSGGNVAVDEELKRALQRRYNQC